MEAPATGSPAVGGSSITDSGFAIRTRRLIQSREHFFWFLHILGWVGYAAAAYFGRLALADRSTHLASVLATAMAGLLLSLVMRYLYRELWYKRPIIVAVGALAVSYVFALLWTLISNQIQWDLVQPWYQPETLVGYFDGAMTSMYVLLCWSGLYFGIKYYQMLQRQTERTLAANAAAHQAQLKMLRYQLNPHFLFNTLNAISTLTLEGNNDAANRCITKLSEFLRYTLETDPMRRVTLGKELEALDVYLEIERVRFGDRLRLEHGIEDIARRCLVPSLITQPIVENSVKYAVAPQAAGATIRISAKTGGNWLVIKITDDGPGLTNATATDKSSGVGLANTRERLRQIFGSEQSFTIAEGDPTGVVVTMRLPMEMEA